MTSVLRGQSGYIERNMIGRNVNQRIVIYQNFVKTVRYMIMLLLNFVSMVQKIQMSGDTVAETHPVQS